MVRRYCHQSQEICSASISSDLYSLRKSIFYKAIQKDLLKMEKESHPPGTSCQKISFISPFTEDCGSLICTQGPARCGSQGQTHLPSSTLMQHTIPTTLASSHMAPFAQVAPSVRPSFPLPKYAAFLQISQKSLESIAVPDIIL